MGDGEGLRGAADDWSTVVAMWFYMVAFVILGIVSVVWFSSGMVGAHGFSDSDSDLDYGSGWNAK